MRVGKRPASEVEERGTSRGLYGGWEKEQREKLRKERLSGCCMEDGRKNSERS